MTILIVGGGKMGMSHLALTTQYVGKESVALCDTKLSTRALFRFLGYRTYSSLDQAFELADHLDGVLIATPTSSHAALVRWAIDKKIPCFVEKPLTLDVNRSEELLRLAEVHNVPVQVGFVMRYVASFQRLRKLVTDQGLGRLMGYTASMRGNVMTKPPSQGGWQGVFALGGGCLNEYGPHLIDLSRFIFGSVNDLGAVRMDRVHCSQADDRIFIDWVHGDGVNGQIEVDWCDPTKRKSVIEFDVRFEHADVRVDNSTVEIKWHDDCKLSQGERALIDIPVQPQNVAYYLRGEEFSLELEDFLGVCLDRCLSVDGVRSVGTTPSLKDGYEVDRLIDAIARKAGLK